MKKNVDELLVFDYDEFHLFIKEKLLRHKVKSVEIAKHIGLSASMVSSVLSGHREFNSEQVVAIGDYLKMSDLEVEYLLTLHEKVAATSTTMKDFLARRTQKLKRQAWRESVQTDSPATFEPKSTAGICDECSRVSCEHWLLHQRK